jgi:hypothetical protein
VTGPCTVNNTSPDKRYVIIESHDDGVCHVEMTISDGVTSSVDVNFVSMWRPLGSDPHGCWKEFVPVNDAGELQFELEERICDDEDAGSFVDGGTSDAQDASVCVVYEGEHCGGNTSAPCKCAAGLVCVTKVAGPDPEPAPGDVGGFCAASSDSDAGCRLVGPDICTRSSECAVVMAGAVEDSGCWSPPVVVGCISANRTCGDGYTYARDPNGKEWMFGSTCIPHSWAITEPGARVSEPCPDDGK